MQYHLQLRAFAALSGRTARASAPRACFMSFHRAALREADSRRTGAGAGARVVCTRDGARERSCFYKIIERRYVIRVARAVLVQFVAIS